MTIDRRKFLKHSVVAAAAGAAARPTATGRAAGANDRVVIGFMGCGGRGRFLMNEFADRADVEVRWLADPDRRRVEAAGKQLEEHIGGRARITQDFREMLDDPEVDGIVGALPDHWHALGTVLACQAGKDVYVEKPTAHSIWESRKMIEAARKYDRVVQVGSQNRSNDYAYAAFEYCHSRDFGEIHFVRVLNSKLRPTIGSKPDRKTPEWLDYDMWLGPAPMRPYNENHFHYNWHWFWAYSGGDIINDGVHQIDVARWMIDQRYPKAVSSAGGIFHYDDDQETPDTHTVNWEYDGLLVTFEQTLWSPYMRKTAMDVRDTDSLPTWPFSGTRIEIYGTRQKMFFSRHGGGWQCFDAEGNSARIHHGRFSPSNTAHIANFIDCIRTRRRPNADIEEQHYSSILAMYGNIAYRTGRRLHIDPATEAFVGDDEANGYIKREYRAPWIVPDTV